MLMLINFLSYNRKNKKRAYDLSQTRIFEGANSENILVNSGNSILVQNNIERTYFELNFINLDNTIAHPGSTR